MDDEKVLACSWFVEAEFRVGAFYIRENVLTNLDNLSICQSFNQYGTRQRGQSLFVHERMHALWNECRQGNSIILSSGLISSRQIGHSLLYSI